MGLREQAALDAQSILEDATSGFGWPFTLMSPLGVASARVGFTTDVGQAIDPDTGQAVAGRRASVAVSLRSLTEMPVAIADASKKPWLVGFLSVTGAPGIFKVVEVLPDRAAGVVVLLLEAYQFAIVPLAPALLVLPPVTLGGELAPVVAIDGALALPPGRELVGELAPVVELGGALALPALALAGAAAVPVLFGGTLALPSIQLSGSLSPAVGALTGALALPSLQLSGTVTLAVSGTLTLPSLQLSGTVTLAVSGTLTLPSLQLSGAITVGATKMIGWLRLAASTAVAGEWPTVVDTLNAGSPMAQPGVNRRAAVGAAPNGRPTMVLDGTDMYLLPPTPTLSSTTKIGFWLWVKFSAAAVTVGGPIVGNLNGAAGATLSRFVLNLNNGGATTNLQIQFFVSNANGRSFGTPFSGIASGVWYAMYLQYDSSRGGDANAAFYLNGILTSFAASSNIGAGGPLGALQAATGSVLVGANADSDAPASALGNGTLVGPNIFTFGDNLTAAEIAAYLGFEVPN